jgi:hypothetical protein
MGIWQIGELPHHRLTSNSTTSKGSLILLTKTALEKLGVSLSVNSAEHGTPPNNMVITRITL